MHCLVLVIQGQIQKMALGGVQAQYAHVQLSRITRHVSAGPPNANFGNLYSWYQQVRIGCHLLYIIEESHLGSKGGGGWSGPPGPPLYLPLSSEAVTAPTIIWQRCDHIVI